MAKNPALATFSVLLLLLVSLVNIAADHADSPSPAPHSPSDSLSPSPAQAPSPAPATSPIDSSPPAPTPENSGLDSPPDSSPVPSPASNPSPAAADAEGVNRAGLKDGDGKSSGGMSSGKKAGIAVGVIAAAGVFVVGCLVYRKRRQNVERSQYGYAARRELL